MPFNGAQLLTVKEPGSSGRRSQFSVMLLDCTALKWRNDDIDFTLDKDEPNYESPMYDMFVAEPISTDIDPAWNSLDHYQDSETALVHYTDMMSTLGLYSQSSGLPVDKGSNRSHGRWFYSL